MNDLRLEGFSRITSVSTGPVVSTYRADEAGREVVLEVVYLSPIPAPARQELEAELLLVARVSTNHPHLLHLLRYFEIESGRMVLVFEAFEDDVAVHLAHHGCLPVRRVLEIGIKTGGALATCHRAGLLHRDVKPAAIKFTEDGEPALGEFAMARLEASARVTMAGPTGRSTHNAPELLKGESASAASDLYGLASTMYAAIAGASPFRRASGEGALAALQRVLHDPVPPLLGPGIPQGLSPLLEEAMAKDPTSRPDVDSFVERLQDVERRAGWQPTTFVVFDPPVLSLADACAGAVTDADDVGSGAKGGDLATFVPTPGPNTSPGRSPSALRCRLGHVTERSDRLQNFCRYCGSELHALCPKGHEAPAAANFCRVCGSPLA